ncbi:hypothetical protein PINS_up018206 [Pythium insidiosum]|nr:hypothetical protein PINS_up018206 [Pythium insidiosum]
MDNNVVHRLKQRKDSVDVQRMNRIESLKARLQLLIDQKKHKEESNLELQDSLAALRPSILLLHSRIGCPDVHSTYAVCWHLFVWPLS